MSISITTQIKYLREEIERKEKTFPRLIAEGRISEEQAIAALATARAVHQTLTQLKGLVVL